MEAELRQIISDEVRRYVQSGGKMAGLAAKTGLGAGTISRIAYGETKYPRMHTVIQLLVAFGYTLTARKVRERLQVVK